MTSIEVIEARPQDLPGLTTIVARSFHPVNPYIESALPDTESVRQWWAKVLETQMGSETSQVLIGLDPAIDEAVGVLVLDLMGAEERGAGVWNLFEWTQDHDKEKMQSMIGGMAEHREKLMFGRQHYSIGLFGVVHEWKGQGVGKKLLQKVCEIADGSGHDVFVQANTSASGQYEKFGFRIQAEAVMPGAEKYTERMMVRRCQRV